MTSEPTQTIQASVRSRVRELQLLLGLSVFLPYLFHLLPTWDDTPFGARLLPIFYAPLIAAITGRVGLGLAIAVISPWANHLLFGMPTLGVATLLTLELSLFSVLLFAMTRRFRPGAWMGPCAYLLTKPFSAALLFLWPLVPAPPLAFLSQSVITSWPGILLLALLGWICKPHSHA